jgi:predicted phage tail protein
MLRTIVLHGELRTRFGERFRMDVDTPREAGRALASQLRDFAQHVRDGLYRVYAGPMERGDARGEEELDLALGKAAEIHIVPVLAGAGGRGGLLKVILGVALIGVGVVGGLSAGFGAAAFSAGGLFSVSWGQIALFGLSMLLQGASSLLAPQPKAQKRPDEKASFLFDGPINVMEQGNVVPLVYGLIRTGGIVVSAALDTEQL